MAPNNVLRKAPTTPEKARPVPKGSIARRGVLTGRREPCGCFVAAECREPGCVEGKVLAWTGVNPEWEGAL